MIRTRRSLSAALGVVAGLSALAPHPARADGCRSDIPGDELSAEQAAEVYDCIAGNLYGGYTYGGKRWVPVNFVREYREGIRASAFPAAPGVHGGRFLITWVNETGAGEYMRYAEDPAMPVGSLLASESFSVSEEGAVEPGPLFLMEKVAGGTSPETDDWYYYMIAPGGKPLAVNVMSACNECHQGSLGATGGMGYPVEEARVRLGGDAAP